MNLDSNHPNQATDHFWTFQVYRVYQARKAIQIDQVHQVYPQEPTQFPPWHNAKPPPGWRAAQSSKPFLKLPPFAWLFPRSEGKDLLVFRSWGQLKVGSIIKDGTNIVNRTANRHQTIETLTKIDMLRNIVILTIHNPNSDDTDRHKLIFAWPKSRSSTGGAGPRAFKEICLLITNHKYV